MLRHLSLTARLTLFCTLVAVTVVVGIGMFFMHATEMHFAELDRAILEDQQRLISDVLSHGDINRLQQLLEYHQDLSIVVRDGSGRGLFQSAGFNPPSPAAATDTALGVWRDQDREFHYLAFAMPSNPSLQVIVALDTHHHVIFLAHLRQSLVLYGLLVALASGLLSYLAAEQGLAPLRAMKKRAAVVTGQQLGERMPEAAVPVEMADLAWELNRMLDRLQEDFQRLSAFSADLAHELRTPISNLLTQTQVALSSTRDAATYKDILASNAEELQLLARTVSDMLYLAKTERGVDLPRREQFIAATEIRALFDFHEAMAEEKRVILRLHGDCRIHGDRLMFRRALSNLLSNALRHSLPDAAVIVDLTCNDIGPLVIVENCGPDLDAKVLSRIFDRFYSADSARSHPGSAGAGLGLSITRAIMIAHGGSVSATSSQGKTRFFLQFPH